MFAFLNKHSLYKCSQAMNALSDLKGSDTLRTTLAKLVNGLSPVSPKDKPEQEPRFWRAWGRKLSLAPGVV
jgi:hypothetical protein